MLFIPDNTFNAVISHAALYHIPREKQCHTLKELVRVTVQGGHIWIGWNGLHDPDECSWWGTHFFISPDVEDESSLGSQKVVDLNILSEDKLFLDADWNKENVGKDFFKRNVLSVYNSYSLVISVK